MHPLASAAESIASIFAGVISIGFSQSTCFPALSAAIAGSPCEPLGVVMHTASTSFRARRSSSEEVDAHFHLLQNACMPACEYAAASSAPGISEIACA